MDGDDKLMALTDEQWADLYALSVENSTNIAWIRETLINVAKAIERCNTDLQAMEIQQSYLKGKMARISVGIATICAIVVNGILWVFTHYGSK